MQAYETHGYEEEVRPQAFYQSNKTCFCTCFLRPLIPLMALNGMKRKYGPKFFHKSTHGYLALFVPCRPMRPMAMKRKWDPKLFINQTKFVSARVFQGHWYRSWRWVAWRRSTAPRFWTQQNAYTHFPCSLQVCETSACGYEKEVWPQTFNELKRCVCLCFSQGYGPRCWLCGLWLPMGSRAPNFPIHDCNLSLSVIFAGHWERKEGVARDHSAQRACLSNFLQPRWRYFFASIILKRTSFRPHEPKVNH